MKGETYMNEFLKETRKREIEANRVDKFKKKSREINIEFYDQIDSVGTMFSLDDNFKEYKVTRDNFYVVVEEKNYTPPSKYNFYSLYGFKFPVKTASFKKVKNDKTIVNINYYLSKETIEKLQSFKSVFFAFNSYSQIIILNLKRLIESGVFCRIIALILSPIMIKEESNDYI